MSSTAPARSKAHLARPRDLLALLRRCHDKLHARGAASDEEDLSLDMVRILVAKIADEQRPGDSPAFFCAEREYRTDRGIASAAKRVRALFDEATSRFPGVFRKDERITVDDRAICDVVRELQHVRLAGADATSETWDLMGRAYEEYTSLSMKRKRGQFFTNRLVVELLVRLTSVDHDDIVLDPAGGSAGFLSGALCIVRRRIGTSGMPLAAARDRIEAFSERLFMVEVSHRLVKVAKAGMILHGGSPAGLTQGDSLGAPDRLDRHLLDQCGFGKPSVILTNPPFAGVGDGRINDERVLGSFECGHRWTDKHGAFCATADLLSDGAPPEMLFFERCVRWLAPGGRLGIVLPKSFLDTATYRPARALLFRECRVLAVISCHRSTFQPHTGVRTALLVAQKRIARDSTPDPPVFMALSRAVGQDSEGAPVYARDDNGNLTDALDEDLTAIATAWDLHQRDELQPSEYRFSVPPSRLDDSWNINPQAHRPSLNATISAIESVEDTPEWSVLRLDDLPGGVEVFKGPRLKSESLIVEDGRSPRDGVEPYYTPSAVLQERRDAAKMLDTTRMSKAQAATVAAIRVRRGDIVITRSGTIGRVAIITAQFDGAIVSDDLIRVRVSDETLRLFLWAYLDSKAGQDQMLRNEYGAIQQHLEPEHVRDILVAIPKSHALVNAIADERRRMLHAKETLARAAAASDSRMANLLGFLATPRVTASRSSTKRRA